MIDIIIPTYKNKQSLRNTLSSINQALLSNFIITVVDDCSNIDYTDIEMQFPFVTLYILQKNVGPGMARQFGIQHTTQPYLLFIDAGDLFYNNKIQFNMVSTIKNNSEIDIFSWSEINQKTGNIQKDSHNRMHGRIYKRTFLQEHDIRFSLKGSYVNEDIGFNRICKIIINPEKYFYSEQPLIIWTYDQNSLTRKNNNELAYNQQNLGLAYNEQHVVQTLIANNIEQQKIQQQVDEIMVALYKHTYKTMQQRPQFTENAYAGARYFYNNVYKNYQNTKSEYFQIFVSRLIKQRYTNKSKWTKDIPLNIYKFLQELNN